MLHPDQEEAGHTVTVPALPGCITQGETVEEALEMAKDANRLYIESLAEDGEPVPEEETAPLQVLTVTVDAPAARLTNPPDAVDRWSAKSG